MTHWNLCNLIQSLKRGSARIQDASILEDIQIVNERQWCHKEYQTSLFDGPGYNAYIEYIEYYITHSQYMILNYISIDYISIEYQLYFRGYARFTSWSWGRCQGICRSAWEMTSLVCTRDSRPNWLNFFKTQFWAQVGMLVLNAMNGLTRMWGTLELRRDTGTPSINKSLIVLANAFRCVHPAVKPGADLHFKPIYVLGKLLQQMV